MAIAVFGRDDRWFDAVTPRILVTMVTEWDKLERQKAKIMGICFASYMNGKDPDEILDPKRSAVATKEQMQKNASAFF